MLVYEYFSAGVFECDDLCEDGLMMLNALLRDFSRVPELEIITAMRPKLRSRISPDIHIENIQPCPESGAEQSFLQALEACEYALIIAPETAGALARLTKMAEERGKLVVGSSSAGVSLAGNKAATLALLEETELPVPGWELLGESAFPESFALPFVVKPVEGAGGEGVRMIKTREQWAAWNAGAGKEKESFLVQEWVSGEAVSVSCLVQNGEAEPICLNRQHVSPGEHPAFFGITAPYHHRWAGAAMDIARRACAQVSGLRGFVGVDFIMGPQGAVVLEINPRLTFAYLALRKATTHNIAEELLAICRDGAKPRSLPVSGSYTCLVRQR